MQLNFYSYANNIFFPINGLLEFVSTCIYIYVGALCYVPLHFCFTSLLHKL